MAQELPLEVLRERGERVLLEWKRIRRDFERILDEHRRAQGRLRQQDPSDGDLVLTLRERQILRRIATGQTSSKIATDLGISEKTVAAHRAHIMDKLQARNTADLVRAAIFFNIVKP